MSSTSSPKGWISSSFAGNKKLVTRSNSNSFKLPLHKTRSSNLDPKPDMKALSLETHKKKKRKNSESTPDISLKRTRTSTSSTSDSAVNSSLAETGTWVNETEVLSVSELCVHKNKVTELTNWIVSAAGRPRLLLLLGPPGCGKTAAVRSVVASVAGRLVEWKGSQSSFQWSFSSLNDSESSDNKIFDESQIVQFKKFLLGADYQKCCTTSGDSQTTADERPKSTFVLVEDLPNALVRSPTSLHHLLMDYTQRQCHAPLIVSVSDCQSTSAHRVIPPNIRQQLQMDVIVMNPVAVTMIKKALTRIAQLHTTCASKMVAPIVQSIAASSSGDVRASINQFQLLVGAFTAEDKHSVAKGGASDANADVPRMPPFIDPLHCLAKLLYAKRDGKGLSVQQKQAHTQTEFNLPDHLLQFSHDLPVSFDTSEIVHKSGYSADMLSLMLQENYLHFHTAQPNLQSLVANTRTFAWVDAHCADWMDKTDYGSQLLSRAMLMYSKGAQARKLNANMGMGQQATSVSPRAPSHLHPLRASACRRVSQVADERAQDWPAVFAYCDQVGRQQLAAEVLPFLALMAHQHVHSCSAAQLDVLREVPLNQADMVITAKGGVGERQKVIEDIDRFEEDPQIDDHWVL